MTDKYCVFNLARANANLAGCQAIGPSHFTEALRYRPKINSIYWMAVSEAR